MKKQADPDTDHIEPMLKKLLEVGDLQDYEREAFESMSEYLTDSRGTLSEKQVNWIESVAKREGLYDTRTAAEVPRGAEVPLLDVLKNLPKRPPRKISPS